MTDVIRVTSGLINTVNDPLIGQPGGITDGPTPLSGYNGQLGKITQLETDDLFFDSTVGTVYGGQFQYVKLADAATAVVAGQIVFWDPDVASDEYQVTTSEAGSSDGAMFRAGIVLNPSWSAGFYSFIQVVGPVFVQFRGTLTAAGAIGSRVFCAAVGAGVDNGFADVIDSSNPTEFSDVSKMLGRWIGTADQAPTNGSLSLVNVNFVNPRF